jgi:hypothetical protein
VAETDEEGAGRVYIGLGVREGGRRGRKPAREIRLPLMAPAGLGGGFPSEIERERERGKWGEGERESGEIFPPFKFERERRSVADLAAAAALGAGEAAGATGGRG